jgi:hypothetical protein
MDSGLSISIYPTIHRIRIHATPMFYGGRADLD